MSASTTKSKSERPKIRPFALIATLAGLSALGQFASNVYIASIPTIALDLTTTSAQVQFTLATFLATFAIGQLLAGPLVDRIGRRPVALNGVVLFAAATLWGMSSPDIETLIAARALQGFGASATIVVSRATVRDLFEGAELARTMALISIVFALVPGLTPLVGGALDTLFGWRSTFGASAVFAGIVLIGAMRLPETRSTEKQEESPKERTAKVYLRLLRSRSFMQPALASALIMGAMSAFFAGSPVVFIERLGVSALEFGLYPPLAVSGFIIGALVVRRSADRWRPRRLMFIGLATMFTFAALMILVPIFVIVHKHVFNASMIGFVSGLGIFLPVAMSAAMSPFGDVAGRCAALLGFLQMTGAASGTVLVALALDLMPIVGFASVMAGMVGLATIWLSLPATKATASAAQSEGLS